MADSSAHFPKEIVQHPIDQLAQSLLENRIASHRAARAVIEWDVLEGLVESATLTHPWPAIRLGEIEHWLPSEHYVSLLKLDFEKAQAQRLRVAVSNLVEKGRSFFGEMLKKSGPQGTPS